MTEQQDEEEIEKIIKICDVVIETINSFEDLYQMQECLMMYGKHKQGFTYQEMSELSDMPYGKSKIAILCKRGEKVYTDLLFFLLMCYNPFEKPDKSSKNKG